MKKSSMKKRKKFVEGGLNSAGSYAVDQEEYPKAESPKAESPKAEAEADDNYEKEAKKKRPSIPLSQENIDKMSYGEAFKYFRGKGKGTKFTWRGSKQAAYKKGEEPDSWKKKAEAPKADAPKAESKPAAPAPKAETKAEKTVRANPNLSPSEKAKQLEAPKPAAPAPAPKAETKPAPKPAAPAPRPSTGNSSSGTINRGSPAPARTTKYSYTDKSGKRTDVDFPEGTTPDQADAKFLKMFAKGGSVGMKRGGMSSGGKTHARGGGIESKGKTRCRYC
jgi:hypothetical protein